MWGRIDIASNGYTTLRFGRLVVHIQRVGDEWRFAYAYDGAESAGHTLREPDWIRLISSAEETLELQPVLPDRPLVIRPEAPVSIFPGRSARFFVSLPVWYRFVAITNKERTTIIEIPSQVLSNTWFGDPSAGELCYALDAPLMRAAGGTGDNAGSATCSLFVRNTSDEKLDFERICAHVENLSVFEHEGRLWTNEISVQYKGAEQSSQISIQNRQPEGLQGAQKLAPPRVMPNKNILRRSVVFFRQFTGI